VSIDSIAKIALKVLGCEDFNIVYDESKPNGQYRKDVCIKKFRKEFPDYIFSSLEHGIVEVYNSLKSQTT
jgi:hypothetical protein